MDLLGQLNAVVVSPEELDGLLEDADMWQVEGRGSAGAGLSLVNQRYRGDHMRALAVYSRLVALAELVATAEGEGWLLPPLASVPPPLSPARCRQEICAWGDSAHDMARGLGGDVRAAEGCLTPLSL